MPKRGRGGRAAVSRAGQNLEHSKLTLDPFRSGASASELSGMQQHSVGELPAFLTSLIINVVMMMVFFIAFSVLRRRYPRVYADNVVANDVPFEPSDSFLGWFAASFRLSLDDVIQHAGLDQALLLEFSHMGMSLLTTLMVPMLFIMAPVHWTFGGDRSGEDRLSKLGMANVVDNHPWLYWVHAVLVWFVVITVQRTMYRAMGKFIERRREWLKAMPAPRATSVLVQNIPDEFATDVRLQDFFNNVFDSDVVESVHVVRHTAQLAELINAKASADLSLKEAQFKESLTGIRPTFMDYTGATHDSITYNTERQEAAAQEITKERRRIQEAEREGDPTIYTRNAFITFKQRRDCELALKATYTSEDGQFVCALPPDPSDVIYTDLQRDLATGNFMVIVGNCAMAAVFWTFLPAVVGIVYIANIDNLAPHFGFIQRMAEDPDTSVMWNGMTGSVTLSIVISFVPTFFARIFCSCFVMKAQAWLQHRIQQWYFWFLVMYVLLLTALGSSVFRVLDKLVEAPAYALYWLAATLPFSMNFFLNFVPLQWVSHAYYCMRTVPLFKFLMYSNIYEEAQAKQLTEPEDQDWEGIGSRSARNAFILVLVIVHCSLTPLMILLGFINCFLCRLVYGYLTMFAEIRKPDLGGVFWVTNLMDVQRSMPIYIALMTGILCLRDATYGPCIIAGSSFSFWYASFSRFESAFRWQSLSLGDLGKDDVAVETPRHSGGTYQQPELDVHI